MCVCVGVLWMDVWLCESILAVLTRTDVDYFMKPQEERSGSPSRHFHAILPLILVIKLPVYLGGLLRFCQISVEETFSTSVGLLQVSSFWGIRIWAGERAWKVLQDKQCLWFWGLNKLDLIWLTCYCRFSAVYSTIFRSLSPSNSVIFSTGLILAILDIHVFRGEKFIEATGEVNEQRPLQSFVPHKVNIQ